MRHLLLALVASLLITGCARRPEEGVWREREALAPRSGVAKPPARPVPAKPTAVPDWHQPRSAWAVQQVDALSADPMMPPYRITVHHSGEAGNLGEEPKELMRLFERNHKAKGWACIGYHFIIAKDGTVYEGRPLKWQGAHAGGDNNIGNIGICVLGNFDHQYPSKVQKSALVDLLDRLCRTYRIQPRNVFGHCHFKTTDCPGPHLLPLVEAFRRGD